MKKWVILFGWIGEIFLVSSNFLYGDTEIFLWQNGLDRITQKGKSLLLYHSDKIQIEILDFGFNFIEPDSFFVEKIGRDSLFLRLFFSKRDGYHSDFPGSILLSISHSPNTFHFSTGHGSFNHITIRIRDRGEHYFGLIEKLYPRNALSPDLRGQTVDVDVYGNGEKDYAENYASAYSAFYMTSLGYASFFDTFAKGRYTLGINGMTEIYHQTDSLNWYIFYGKDGSQIHEAYYRVIGKPKFIPLWACGPIFWRDENKGGEKEILEDIRHFIELEIPLTACWVDRPYSHGAHGWSKMDFGKGFEHPEKWIREVKEKFGLEFMTWVAPMTFSDRNFPGLLPGDPGYIDLTHPDALVEFNKRLKVHQYAFGVKGHKMDRADEHFPLTFQWFTPVSESETRNRYVFLYAKTIHEFLKSAWGEDQFNFARAAFHRCQPYLSAVWGGDNRNNWQGMAGNQANVMRCGFLGFPIWGQDTGGYLGEGKIDERLYIRWLQWGLYNGFFEIKMDGAGGNGEDRPPWKYSQHFQNIFRAVCEKRMELLPYIYSCANTSYRNGILMKPLAYAFPSDTNTYSIWDEYLFGNAFLVAPIFSEDSTRKVYLPKGTWIEETNLQKMYRGPCWVTVSAPIEKIPVFIGKNSMYVTGEIFRGNSKIWKGPLQKPEITFHAFPGEMGDSTRFDYVDVFDNHREKTVRLFHLADEILFQSEALSTPSVLAIQTRGKPKEVQLSGKPILFYFAPESGMTKVKIEKNTLIEIKIKL